MPQSPSSPNRHAAFPKGVAKPAQRALAAAGFASLDQLAHARKKDLAALHGMGPTALDILHQALQATGKDFLPWRSCCVPG